MDSKTGCAVEEDDLNNTGLTRDQRGTLTFLQAGRHEWIKEKERNSRYYGDKSTVAMEIPIFRM